MLKFFEYNKNININTTKLFTAIVYTVHHDINFLLCNDVGKSNQ